MYFYESCNFLANDTYVFAAAAASIDPVFAFVHHDPAYSLA